MSDTDELIRKVREGQKKDETDALINQARAAQQSPSTDVVIAQARTTVPKEVPAGGLFGLMGVLGIKEKVSPPTPPQPGQPLATGEAYAVGQDPRKGFWGNVGEALIDPSEIAQMAATGGLTGLITKGPKAVIPTAKSFTYEWAPDIVKGVAGFGNKFLEGLGAKAAETGRKLTSEVAADIIAASRPAERIAAELIAEGSQPSVATITKTIALNKQGAVEYLETVYPHLKAEERGTKILREIAEKDVAAVAKLPAEKIAAMTPQERLAYQTALAEAKLIGPRTPVTLEQAAQLRKMGLAKKEIEKLTTEDAAAMIVREQTTKAPSVTGLTESEKLSTPILGPGGEQMGAPIGGRGKPPSGGEPWENFSMTKDDWDWLRTPPKPGGIGVAEGVLGVAKEKAGRVWNSTMMAANPPQWVVQHEPTGRLSKMYQLMDESIRKSNASLHAAITDFRANITIPRDSKDAETLAIWLDTYENAPRQAGPMLSGKLPTPTNTIPITDWNSATPELRNSFVWMRNAWDKMGEELVKRNMLAPEKKLKNYFFHMFPKEEVVAMWKNELGIINSTLEQAATKGMTQIEIAKKYASILKNKVRIEQSISTYEKQGTILYDYIPKGIEVPFLKERKGVEGWLVDPHRAFERYLHLYHDKLYKEPVVREARVLMEGLTPDWKFYAHRLVKNRYMGIGDPILGPMKDAEHVLTSLQFASSMGGNLPSAVRNFTQNVNTIVDAGAINTWRGVGRAMSSKGKAEWTTSGHAIEIPGLEFESLSALRTIQDKLAYFFSKVESANRRIAFSAGLEKAERAGLTGIEATRIADDVLKRTQFYYGKLGAPLLMDVPGMSITYQFGTYTLNQLNLFHSWLKKEPLKFVSYLGVANGIAYGAEKLGLDLWGALGLGIDFKQLGGAITSLFSGETEKAKAQWRMAMPWPLGEGAQSGVLPSSIAPVIDSVKKIYHQEWSKALPVTARRLYETGQALWEGEREQPALGAAGEGMASVEAKKGYPVRQIPLGTAEKDIKSILTLPQLLARPILGRPMAETRAQEASTLSRVLGDIMQEKKEDFKKNVAPLVAQGQSDAVDNWLAQQKPEVVTHVLLEMNTMLKDAAFKNEFSSDYRLVLQNYLNRKMLQYRIGVFSTERDSTKQLP